MAQILTLPSWCRAAAAAPARVARLMDHAGATDAALMQAAGAGDRAAFAELVSRHGERALRLALRVLGDTPGSRDEAEDVAQEAFLRAWQAAAGFDPERARFTTWLHRIVLNLAIDRARRRATAGPSLGPEVLAEWPDSAPGPEEQVATAERSAALHAALAALPPKHRAAIALAYEDELSGAEAAAALDVSERALEGLLRRARQALRALLEGKP